MITTPPTDENTVSTRTKNPFSYTQQDIDQDWFYQLFKEKTIQQSILWGIVVGFILCSWERILHFVLTELWTFLGIL